ncbi:MAG: GntR family transcriptional regulator [Candidatus Delongbacteria bacterium]|nr:GntR family transcriptional regulator [Candidatus Delongbacteria bacterium]
MNYDQQIKESIKALILDQTFYYQSKLPKPSKLAKYLNIDQKFVILAYEQLIFEHYIKENEDNTFSVSYFELTNYFFDRNVAIYDAIIALGLTPSIECVEKKVVKLDQQTLNSMGFPDQQNSLFFYLNRLYKGDNQPIIILENYLPLSIFPDIDKNFKGDEPLNAYLDQHYDIRAKVSNRTTQAVNLSAILARYLNERKNAASIRSTNRVYDQNERLIDFGRSHTISSYYFQALITRNEINSYFQNAFSIPNNESK